MRMRKKPKKPVPEIHQYQDDIDNFDTVGDMVRYLKEWDVSINDVFIKLKEKDRYWDDYAEYIIQWEIEETDKEFQKRMNKYEKNLEEYNQWYEENREEIEKRSKKKKEDEQEKAKKRIKQLTKEIEKEKKKLK